MARPHLLLVDADPRVVRVLEVNLKNDGFSVTTAIDGAEAAAKLEIALPDVLVAETRLSRVDGFELVRRLRSLPGGEDVAVILIAPEVGGPGPSGLSAAAMDQLRAVELGIGDCLCKPVSVRELVTRVNLMLARRTQAMLASSSAERTHFSGHLQDIGVIDLLAAFEAGRRSGILQIEHASRAATVLFKNGKVVDAEQGQLRGEEALYRTLLWTTGVFDVEFADVDVPDNVPVGTAALIMEGMRRIDEWGRLAEQLPSSTSVFTVDAEVLLGRLAEVPDDLNAVLRLFDGQRSLMGVIDESPFDDLSTLSVVSKLFFEGVLRVIEPAPPSVLLSARALSAGTTRAEGNVIKMPHVADRAAAVVVRPNAPGMSADPLPRSLVYSEPPQNLRLSQRPKGSTSVVSGPRAAVVQLASAAPTEEPKLAAQSVSPARSQTPADLGTESAEGSAVPRRAEDANQAEVKRGSDAKRAVAEAEFEDLSERNDAAQPAGSVPSHLAASETSASAAMPEPTVTSRAADRRETLDGDKPSRELDHDFFADGEGTTFDLGAEHDATRRSRPDVDIDPRVLAALQARRHQGRRWAAWIVGGALLLLVWGLVMVLGGDSEQDPVASGAAVSNPAPSAPVPVVDPVNAGAQGPVPNTAPLAEPSATFEEVPPVPPKLPANVGTAASQAPSLEASPPLGPVRPNRGKRPPTARFPSTPEHQ